MRYSLLIALCLGCWSCREILPFEGTSPTNGYLLKGTVTTQNGLPLDSVSVQLYYTYDVAATPPIDTAQVIITDSTKIVFVAVYTRLNQFVRQLFLGYRSPGPLPYFRWDELDEHAQAVPSGKYFIRYVYDTTIVKEKVYIVDGGPTATTNENGNFTISNDYFPIGEIFDDYSNSGKYIATIEVQSLIGLKLTRGNLSKFYAVSMELNTVTRGAFILK